MKKNTAKKNTPRRRHRANVKQRFPQDWSERKVRSVIRHYEQMTDDELAREIETAEEMTEETLISVPKKLLPAVRELIVRHRQTA